MRKLVSFMHISLDGYVAAVDGDLSWIHINEEIFGYVGQRIRETDTALYGRVTYDMMEAYWPTAADQPNASRHDIDHSQWYTIVKKIVLSKTLKDKSLVNTKIVCDNFIEEITQIKNSSGSEILIFGSPKATHALMAANLVDEYWLLMNPVLLGDGIRLFNGHQDKTQLELVSSKVFTSGVIGLHYKSIYNR